MEIRVREEQGIPENITAGALTDDYDTELGRTVLVIKGYGYASVYIADPQE